MRDLHTLIQCGEIIDNRRREEVMLAKLARQAAAEAKHTEEWEPILSAVADALPDWMGAGLSVPEDDPTYYRDYSTYYRPVTLQLPDLAPIYCYSMGKAPGNLDDGNPAAVFFQVPKPDIWNDEYGDGGWQAYYRRSSIDGWHEMQCLETSLDVAVYQATLALAEFQQQQQVAEQRNLDAANRQELEQHLAAVPAPVPPVEVSLAEIARLLDKLISAIKNHG